MTTHTPHPDLPPPSISVGVIGWIRANLFSSWPNSLLTLASIYLLYLSIPPLIEWTLIKADWVGETRDACDSGGECTDFINQFISRNITAVRLYVLLRTEEEREKHQGSGLTFAKPIMGDAPAETITVGRFHYSYMSYEIFLRNYNIIY